MISRDKKQTKTQNDLKKLCYCYVGMYITKHDTTTLRRCNWYPKKNKNSYQVSICYCSIDLQQHFVYLLRTKMTYESLFLNNTFAFTWKSLFNKCYVDSKTFLLTSDIKKLGSVRNYDPNNTDTFKMVKHNAKLVHVIQINCRCAPKQALNRGGLQPPRKKYLVTVELLYVTTGFWSKFEHSKKNVHST